MRSCLSLVLISTILMGCSSSGGVAPEGVGAGVGAVSGGLIGSQFGKGKGKVATTILGAAAGTVVGFGVGQWLYGRDREQAERAQFSALESGQSNKPVSWRGADGHSRGEVVPSSPYRRGTENCRDYNHTIYVDGRPQTLRGTACRNPDGTWRSVG